jgi:hypothetical protein
VFIAVAKRDSGNAGESVPGQLWLTIFTFRKPSPALIFRALLPKFIYCLRHYKPFC